MKHRVGFEGTQDLEEEVVEEFLLVWVEVLRARSRAVHPREHFECSSLTSTATSGV